MAIVPVPWSSRHWALPFLTILQPSKKANEEAGRRHKTSIDWTIQALKALRRWEPTRGIILLADGGFASFDLLEITRTTPALFALFSLICCAAISFHQNGELIPRASAWYKKDRVTFSDLMAVMRRKTWARKYFKSNNLPEQKIFSQDDVQVLIHQLLNVA